MTPEQLATLKTYILSQPDLASEPMNGDGYFNIALKLNNDVEVPDFFVWRTQVTVNEVMGTGFDWTRVDNQTVGEARIWQYMTQVGVINPNQANVRAGVNEAFKGTAQDDTMRLAMYTNHLQSKATRVQKLYATGAGTTSTDAGAGPATLVIQSVTPFDVEQARTLP